MKQAQVANVTNYNQWLMTNGFSGKTGKEMSLTARGNDYLSRIEETASNQKVRLAPISEMRAKFSQTAFEKVQGESTQRENSNEDTVGELTQDPNEVSFAKYNNIS